jgi:hypothetical protein
MPTIDFPECKKMLSIPNCRSFLLEFPDTYRLILTENIEGNLKAIMSIKCTLMASKVYLGVLQLKSSSKVVQSYFLQVIIPDQSSEIILQGSPISGREQLRLSINPHAVGLPLQYLDNVVVSGDLLIFSLKCPGEKIKMVIFKCSHQNVMPLLTLNEDHFRDTVPAIFRKKFSKKDMQFATMIAVIDSSLVLVLLLDAVHKVFLLFAIDCKTDACKISYLPDIDPNFCFSGHASKRLIRTERFHIVSFDKPPILQWPWNGVGWQVGGEAVKTPNKLSCKKR